MFEFVEGDCDLSIERVGGAAEAELDFPAEVEIPAEAPAFDIQALLQRVSGAEAAPVEVPPPAPVASVPRSNDLA